MNIIDYINYYGDNTFSSKEFNEIDNLIFSLITYVDLSNIVFNKRKKALTIEETYKKFSSLYDEEYYKKQFTATKNGIDVFKAAANSNRFKDVKIMNYVYVGDKKSQFCAVSFEINPNLFYVGFEGTDHLISGWEEDCKMAYRFPVEAQTYAKNYLNKHYTFKNCKIIVGGHSKGGNLALVSSMYSNMFVKKKIIKIYSNDGQGLRKAQLESKQYSSIEDRFIHIVPDHSIVGMLLRNKDNYHVIKSNKKGVMAHSGLTWQVSYDHFEIAKLSRFSKVFQEGFSKWLDNYDDEKRKKFVKSVFDVLYKNNINSLTEIKLKKDIIKGLLSSSKELDPVVKQMSKELFIIINKTNIDYPWF